MLFLDCETLPFSAGCKAPPLVSLAIGSIGNVAIHHRSDAWQGHAFAALQGDVAGHNIPYDLAVMMANCGELVPHVFDALDSNRVVCTEVRQRLIDVSLNRDRFIPAKEGKPAYYWAPPGHCGKEGGEWRVASYRLADLAHRHLHVQPDGKGTIQTRFHEMWNVPVRAWPREFYEYANRDVELCACVYNSQAWQPAVTSTPQQYAQTRAYMWLSLASAWGIWLNMQAAAELRGRLEAERDALLPRLAGAASLVRKDGTRDLKAAKHRITAAYAARGLAVPRTDKDGVALDREACENSGDALMIEYASYCQLNSILNKDLGEAFAVTPIHNSYVPIVDTGRTASRKPNIQNFPRRPGVRECLEARDGCYFLEGDYSGLELATLAEVCYALFGVSNLGDAINAGIDPHLTIGAEILGMNYDVAKAIRDSGPQENHSQAKNCKCPYCDVDNARQAGKVANFGNPGGLGPSAFCHYAKQSYGLDITEDFARYLKKVWSRFLPEMRDYFRFIESCGESITQLYSNRVRGGITFTSGCNTLFQGLGADLAKDAGWRICREQYDVRRNSPMLASRTVLFGHDAFLLEVQKDMLGPVAKRLTELMLEASAVWTPRVKMKVELIAMKRYTKKPIGDNKVQIPVFA